MTGLGVPDVELLLSIQVQTTPVFCAGPELSVVKVNPPSFDHVAP